MSRSIQAQLEDLRSEITSPKVSFVIDVLSFITSGDQYDGGLPDKTQLAAVGSTRGWPKMPQREKTKPMPAGLKKGNPFRRVAKAA